VRGVVHSFHLVASLLSIKMGRYRVVHHERGLQKRDYE
jgi:hypothetical protein